jgi:hypothetical protein
MRKIIKITKEDLQSLSHEEKNEIILHLCEQVEHYREVANKHLELAECLIGGEKIQ